MIYTIKKDISAACYAVYFDFRKAFDLNSYHILLQKLAKFGFDEKFINIVQILTLFKVATSINQ